MRTGGTSRQTRLARDEHRNQRVGAEDVIKEVNGNAGLTAHPSGRWMMNANWARTLPTALMNSYAQANPRKQ